MATEPKGEPFHSFTLNLTGLGKESDARVLDAAEKVDREGHPPGRYYQAVKAEMNERSDLDMALAKTVLADRERITADDLATALEFGDLDTRTAPVLYHLVARKDATLTRIRTDVSILEGLEHGGWGEIDGDEGDTSYIVHTEANGPEEASGHHEFVNPRDMIAFAISLPDAEA